MAGVAHPITAEPFVLVQTPPGGDPTTHGSTDREHPSEVVVRRDGEHVILQLPPDTEATINDDPVEGTFSLKTGDRLRLAPHAEEIIFVTMVE
jgi:hypothetical protein